MGLDVYLYRYDDYETTTALEDEADRFSSSAWESTGKKYEAMEPSEKDAVRETVKAFYHERGLDEWGSDAVRKFKLEQKSAKYPEHYCEVGYLRSSYNDAGFNTVVRQRIGRDGFYYIFDPGEEYHVRPDWAAAKARALEVARKLKEAAPFRAMTVSVDRLFGEAPDTGCDAALKVFLAERDQKEKQQSDYSAYSSAKGHFWLKEGITIHAAIPGVDAFNQRAVHLVYRDTDENIDWYVQAAEIAAEMCDYVLAQPDADKYVLHWSS